MSLFTVEHIHRWAPGHNGNGIHEVLIEISKDLKIIQKQNQLLMAKFADIKVAFDELKTAVTDERAQANAKLDELLGKIDQLETNINEGGTTEERAQFLADVKSLATEVKSIIPDPATDPIEEPPVEGENGGSL